ncbi:prepilin-type N-terminal cleavage/methylation domain-containing protein [bacterium]|nr:prepilin-type N-terminal cleavage/methylation domain-containing protein [bacterium]
MRLITRPKKAFSLLELLITMSIISILMAAAAPGVDAWVSRYQTRTFISRMVSDFSEAKILATTAGSHRGGGTATNTDPFSSAIRFTSTEYQLITRSFAPVSNTSWDPALANNTLIKSVPYPRGVVVASVRSSFNNGAGVTTVSDNASVNPTFVFLSTGFMQNKVSGRRLVINAPQFCGPGRTLPPATLSVNVTADQKLSSAQAFYRVNINPNGDYGVCYAPTSTGFPTVGQFMNSF